MEHCFKIMCIVVSLVIVVGSVGSCALSSKAFDPADPADWALEADEYRRQLEQELTRIGRTINSDIQSGNFDATTELAKNKLNTIGLQYLFVNNPAFKDLWHALDLALQTVPDYTEVENLPDTIPVSGQGATGLYTSYKDGKQHLVNTFFIMEDGTFILSDEFNVSVSVPFNGAYGHTFDPPNGSGVGGFLVHTYYDPYFRSTSVSISDSMGYFNSLVQYSQAPNVIDGKTVNFTGAPSPLPASYLSHFSNSNVVSFGSYGVHNSLPQGDINTFAIWNYYNNVLLPYILNNYYFDGIDNYLMFPDGYHTIDPVEPPTMPNGGVNITNNNINIDIDIQYINVTDESGETITDESGEPVTETITQYITDTTPTDAVYKFTIPTLPDLNKYEETIPALNLSAFSDGISFIFTCANGIFTDTGFLPVIIVTLTISAIVYVMWKVGG